MRRNNRLKITEIAILAVIWLVLLASPILFREESDINFDDMKGPLQSVVPLFLLFLLNRFILVPKLFFRKKYLIYFLSIGLIIVSFTLLLHFFPQDRKINQPPRRMNMENEMHTPPPYERLERDLPPPMPEPQRGRPVAPFANFLIFAFLLVGFDTGLSISFKLGDSERENTRLEKENVGSQLAFLRNQVSPHFFMNTLNNIHALIDIDTEEAKESIIRLSKLMRHLLYESELGKIAIQKEIDFVRHYIDLMKMRYSDKVEIGLHTPDIVPDKCIPPLLFTSFVENAFKHGISYKNDSFINITFACTDENLTFCIKNSIPGIENTENKAGIGIRNARKRLDLLYGNAYSLEIIEGAEEFVVRLSIPI